MKKVKSPFKKIDRLYFGGKKKKKKKLKNPILKMVNYT